MVSVHTPLNSVPGHAPEAVWTEALRSSGRRVTKQRLAVMAAASTHPHATAEELHRASRGAIPDLALATTHMIVNDLTSSGLLRRLEVPHSASRYEPDLGDNHHHAQCVRCGRLEDVACAVGHAPCLTPTDTHGMNILVAEVLYRGICAACAAEDRASDAPTTPEVEEHSHG